MEQTRRLKGHSGDVYAIEVAPDDAMIRFGNMISGGDYTIKTWNTEVCHHLSILVADNFSPIIKDWNCKPYITRSYRLRELYQAAWQESIFGIVGYNSTILEFRGKQIEMIIAVLNLLSNRVEKECMCLKDTKI